MKARVKEKGKEKAKVARAKLPTKDEDEESKCDSMAAGLTVAPSHPNCIGHQTKMQKLLGFVSVTFFRFVLASTWVPPENEAVCRFVRRVKRTLCARYVDRQTWLDTKARQWLKKHRRSMIIVDADKGLCDVMMPRQWVEDEM